MKTSVSAESVLQWWAVKKSYA